MSNYAKGRTASSEDRLDDADRRIGRLILAPATECHPHDERSEVPIALSAEGDESDHLEDEPRP